MKVAACILGALTVANAQFLLGGPGIACPPNPDRPTDVAEGRQCGGWCNQYGDCVDGFECKAKATAGGAGMLLGGGGPSVCKAAAPDEGCGGCVDTVTDDNYDSDTMDAAKAAVGLIDAQSNSMFGSQFVQIVPGTVTTQVVAGIKYTMSIQVGLTACRNSGDGTTLAEDDCPVKDGAQITQYHIEMVSAPWQTPPLTLLDFAPEQVSAGSVETATTAPSSKGRGGVTSHRPQAAGCQGDGSMTICMLRLACQSDEVSIPHNGCSACVDATTCLASGH